MPTPTHAIDTDELPPPPSTGEAAPQVAPPMDPADLGEVPEFGHVIPNGTYHFRLDKVYLNWNDPRGDADAATKLLGAQPGYGLLWIVQEEPHTGLSFMDNCPYINAKTIEEARAGNTTAKKLMRRLSKLKKIMAAAGFNPGGPYSVEGDFFGANPEVKIRTNVAQKKQREVDDDGQVKYVDTGKKQNEAVDYFPLTRPT